MARKQGGVNKFLNFIGLVDDERRRGPRTTVTPTATAVRRPMCPSSSARARRTPAGAPSSRTSAARYGADRYGSTRVPTPASRRTTSAGYDYTPARERARATSRLRTRAQTRAQRQRTLMCSLNTLEDCCDVIDSLIAGNVVVLTLDEIDPKLTQRAIDTLSGAVFALSATIRKASDRTYVLAPNTVEVNETYDVERRF